MFTSASSKPSLISRLGDFFSWWIEQLSGLVPSFVTRYFQADDYLLQLDVTAGKLLLVDVNGHNVIKEVAFDSDAAEPPKAFTTALSDINASNLDTHLILGSKDVLFIDVTLPLEAEPDLENILGYEMDRQTPFKIDQVYFDYVVDKSADDKAHMLVKLVVVPRELVDNWLDRLKQWQLCPESVGVRAGNNDDLDYLSDINLLPAELRTYHPLVIAKLNGLLIVAAILMLVFSVYLSLNRQSNFIEQLNSEIALLSDDVRQVQKLRKQIDHLGDESERIVEIKQQTPGVIRILNDLSIIMPQHAWLQRFELNGGQLRLQGESSNATELIGLIEASPKFQNASFTSPVVRDAKTGRDRFQLRVNLAPQGGDL